MRTSLHLPLLLVLASPAGAGEDPWPSIRKARIQSLLPGAMERAGVDAWLLVCRENDNDPLRDGQPPAGCGNPCATSNLGRGVLSMMAQAFGPDGTSKTIEVTLARTDTTELERGYTGQRGQDEQNRRSRKAPVQTPGKALTRSTWAL